MKFYNQKGTVIVSWELQFDILQLFFKQIIDDYLLIIINKLISKAQIQLSIFLKNFVCLYDDWLYFFANFVTNILDAKRIIELWDACETWRGLSPPVESQLNSRSVLSSIDHLFVVSCTINFSGIAKIFI